MCFARYLPITCITAQSVVTPRRRRCALIDKLDFLVRFWELKARNASLGEPLVPREQIELLSLMQLVTGDLDVPAVGPVERPRSALPAQMIGDGTILPVEIRSVSAGGRRSSVARRSSPRARTSSCAPPMRSRASSTSCPCNVLWVYRGAPTILALSVDGIPTRSVFVGVPEPRHVDAPRARQARAHRSDSGAEALLLFLVSRTRAVCGV